MTAIDFGEPFGRLERPDGIVQKREDIAGLRIQHVIGTHHIDDRVRAEPLCAEFE